jgi:hypothetical protein
MSALNAVTVPERSARRVGSFRSPHPGSIVSKILTVRWAAPAAAIVFGVLTLGLDLAVVPLDILTHQTGPGGPVAAGLSTAAVVVPAVAVGTLLAARRPCNPIGWILLAIIFLGVSPTDQYAVLDYRMHYGTLPLGWAVVVLGDGWPLFLPLIAILLWLFPDGRLPPGRWRRTALALVTTGVLIGLAASAPGVVAVAGHDIRIGADGSLTTEQGGAWMVLQIAVAVGTIAALLAWLVVQVPSYRRSADQRRQQLKWLYSGGTVFLVSVLLGIFIVPLALGDAAGYGPPVVNDLVNLGAAALPVCIGVAVLKYRLYSIDRIISRVISYTIITAVLAGVFAGLVILASNVLPVKTPVAVAAATLAAAALFDPLRRRVQRAVDRRFNRAHYNAEAVVAAFTRRLRQTVDPGTAQDDLVATIHHAFQPAHISVWLPPGISVEPLRPETDLAHRSPITHGLRP